MLPSAAICPFGPVTSKPSRIEVRPSSTSSIRVEVSSPGFERTLPTKAHYERADGRDVRLKTDTGRARGTVLAAGGFANSNNSGVLQSAEVYDPNTGQWSQTANMIGGHAHHVALILFGGKILVAGGLGLGNTWQRGAEIYSA